MSLEMENNEAQIFGLIQRFDSNNQILLQIQEQKDGFSRRGERGGEILDVLLVHVEVAQGLAEEISHLLPDEKKISDDEEVVWRGPLSDLQFSFLGGNQFKIIGPNLVVKEHRDEVKKSPDLVTITMKKDVELAVDPGELAESLYGIIVKIYHT